MSTETRPHIISTRSGGRIEYSDGLSIARFEVELMGMTWRYAMRHTGAVRAAYCAWAATYYSAS